MKSCTRSDIGAGPALAGAGFYARLHLHRSSQGSGSWTKCVQTAKLACGRIRARPRGMAAQSPHDALFKGIFSRPDRAAELLRASLRPELVRSIDWASLSLVPGSFVDEQLRSHHADLLFTARMAERDICIYKLLEH